MKQSSLLQVKNLPVQLAGKSILAAVSFSVETGECLAIVGSSGSGKSTLLQTIANSLYDNNHVVFAKKNNAAPLVTMVSQQHHFKNLSNTSTFYYQQRFNSNDSEDALMVLDVLKNISENEIEIQNVLKLLGIAHVAHTRLIQLSNGEHKRLQLAKAILQNADWILLDNPCTGLDISARQILDNIIKKLIAKGINILLVTSFVDVPDFVTHVAVLDKGLLQNKILREQFIKEKIFVKKENFIPYINLNALESVLPVDANEFEVAVKMVNVHVIYNDKKILDNINWKVNKGECWNVSGHNGSGKSTLLSLITGDNPQAFANEIYLFDRREGSGESIWDIKKKIGFVSPELHHYFDAGNTCFDVVASGLFDTTGLFKKINIAQRTLVNNWMNLLNIAVFGKRLFKQLSNGEQRLILLARALIKNPPLLILDEPCQGLDDEVKQWFIGFINDICISLQKTLIYVSHYEEEIPSCVSHTLKLENGRVAA